MRIMKIPSSKKEMREELSGLIKKEEANARKYLLEVFTDLEVESSKRTSFGEVLYEFFKKETPLEENNKLEIMKQYGVVIVNIFTGVSIAHIIGENTTNYAVVIQFQIDKENNNLSIFKVEYQNSQESLRFNYGEYFFKNYTHLKKMISKIDLIKLWAVTI